MADWFTRSVDGPLVILLEDLHWADGASLELLRFMAPRLRHMSVVVIGTYAAVALARICRFPHEAELSQQAFARLAPQASVAALPDGLTDREVEVIRLVARGLKDKEIAGKLFISIKTVQAHLRRRPPPSAGPSLRSNP